MSAKRKGFGWVWIAGAVVAIVAGLAAVDLLRGRGGEAWLSGVAARPAPATPPVEPGATLFRNVRLFDGESVREEVDVRAAGGVIEAIGADLDAAGAIVIDGAGHTLMPGLIDSHTHAFGPVLREALAFGVTTELDMFTEASGAAALKAEQAAGTAADRADIFSAGFLATTPGGHGTEYGLEIPTLSTPEEAGDFVAARAAEGSDYLKIVYIPDSRRFTSLDLPTIGALIDAAHQRDMLAVVHVSEQQAALDVIALGADAIVHAWDDTAPEPATAAAFVQAKAFVIPTLAVIESVAGGPAGKALLEDDRLAPLVTPTSRINLETTFDWASERGSRLEYAIAAVAALHEAGVPILAGTDAPNPGTGHGVSMHRELELLVRAGLDPVEVLAAATWVPARQFGLEDRGRIAVGARADLLLVQGDPTKDVLATRAIAGVWKQGVRFDHAAYRAALEATGVAAEKGLVSSFDHGEIDAALGVGWQISTDQMMGGKSTAAMEVTAGGAADTTGKLTVAGELVAGASPWAGPMLMTGDQPFAPADLSGSAGISFWARGDAGHYAAMFFAANAGQVPIVSMIELSQEWQQYQLPFTDFAGADPALIQAFLITPSAPGTFRFELDEVTLY